MQHSDVRQFYAAHREELERYLKGRVNCAQTAADLTQEVFVRLMRSELADRVENPRAYLYRIASNLLVDHYRRAGQNQDETPTDVIENVPDPAPSPEGMALTRGQLALLQQAIDELPARQRQVLVLHKFEDLSYAEIGIRLGIAKNTVMVHMMRALAHCRDRMTGNPDD